MNKENEAIAKTPQFYLVMLILIVMVLETIATVWRTIELGVMAIGAWTIWTFYQQRKQSQQSYLKELFYQLIQENNGYITALDLAMKANISAQAAATYLERSAQEFAAELEVNQQGGILYLFTTARAASVIDVNVVAQELLEKPLPKSTEIRRQLKDNPAVSVNIDRPKDSGEEIRDKNQEIAKLPLNQSQLAKRLQVHSSTVSKRKLNANFDEWSCNLDPKGVAWQYSSETKRFYPMKNLSNDGELF
ncbi:MAG: hypothetical protein GDA43_11260 [Hormoscilla sp. SP5CHS1]|nr:hypothetical protein [Hormoscilla sp. SP12CHS1]MBC6453713.1 hypothetical protein [Hormoscilla sp. SP5CHS1]